MVITVGPDLKPVLIDLARKKGVAPEELAFQGLRELFALGGDAGEPAGARPSGDRGRGQEERHPPAG